MCKDVYQVAPNPDQPYLILKIDELKLELGYGLLAAQVELARGAGDEVGKALLRQAAHQRGADHPAMAGYVNFCLFWYHKSGKAAYS